jgi:hypothetical protein
MTEPDNDPDGFSVHKTLHDVIYKITPEEASKSARMGARQVYEELLRMDPAAAAAERKRKRELKAWRRERKRQCAEIGRLQIPFVLVGLNVDGGEDEAKAEAAGLILRVSDRLFADEAPQELICDLLKVAARWLAPPEAPHG